MTVSVTRPPRGGRATIPTLRVVAGPDMLRFVTLPCGQELVLGRGEDCGLVLQDGSVSRHHARIVCDSRGMISIEDLGSTNGVAVNGHSVARAAIASGALVELGSVALRLDHLDAAELAHLIRVRDKLQSAGCDPLTGLRTRACLEDHVPDLVAQCESRSAAISAVFLDLDGFKDTNDRYGHGVGDQVLRDAARILMLGLREHDVCLRYGGEEFLVLLPGAAQTEAVNMAERMRLSLAGHDWDRTAEGLAVTGSFGVAERRAGEALGAWIARADEALYEAKRLGRNQVRSDQPVA